MSGTVKVKFTKERGRRKEGDVVSYDDVSAAHIVEEGAAAYVDDSPVEPSVPVATAAVTTVAAAPPKVIRPPKSDES